MFQVQGHKISDLLHSVNFLHLPTSVLCILCTSQAVKKNNNSYSSKLSWRPSRYFLSSPSSLLILTVHCPSFQELKIRYFLNHFICLRQPELFHIQNSGRPNYVSVQHGICVFFLIEIASGEHLVQFVLPIRVSQVPIRTTNNVLYLAWHYFKIKRWQTKGAHALSFRSFIC